MPGDFRAYSPSLQAVAVLSGFVIKPAYMALSLALIWALRGRGETDLSALRASLAAFFIGECFCYANIFFYHHGALWPEVLHSAGMAAALGLGVFAAVEGLRSRVLREPCPLCGPCSRCTREDGSCRLARLAPWAALAGLVLSALPFSAPLSTSSYHTLIGRFPYDCTHSLGVQALEFRLFPALAALLLAASLLARRGGTPHRALFSAGLGLLLFSGLRLMLFSPFQDSLVWFDFWEETTELIALCALALTLWTFREGLLKGGET